MMAEGNIRQDRGPDQAEWMPLEVGDSTAVKVEALTVLGRFSLTFKFLICALGFSIQMLCKGKAVLRVNIMDGGK